MSKSPEELARELEKIKKANAAEENKKTDLAAAPPVPEIQPIRKKKSTPTVETPPESSPVTTKEVKKTKQSSTIYDAYDKTFGHSVRFDKKDKTPLLDFDSEKQAEKFFTDQAKGPSKHPFFVQILNNDKPTGTFYFSCGDGRLYTGSIETIKAQMKQVNASETDTLRKEGVKQLDEYIESKTNSAPKKEEEAKEEDSSSPSP